MTEERLKLFEKAETRINAIIDTLSQDKGGLAEKLKQEDVKDFLISLWVDCATENGIQWHKITDWKNQEQFPQEETFPFFVRTKKDGDYLCEWEITEGCGQFYSMYEGEDIDPEDVVLWAKIEVPQFKE